MTLGASRSDASPRLRSLVEENLSFVWRSLRRLGVREGEVEDVAQRVFLVVADKLPQIEVGHERAFVFGTALRMASHARRSRARRREELGTDLSFESDPHPNPEERAIQQDALEQVASALDHMPEELRSVFVLFELEELKLVEIAEMVELPLGTVASRLHRARAVFKERIGRLSGPQRRLAP